MDRQAIYRKTAKGQEEMATRAFKLPARERSLLVLVDGKSTGAQLLARTAHLGDPGAFLEHLIADGFVEAVGAPAAASQPIPAAPAAVPRPSPAASASRPSAAPGAVPREAVNFARRYLIDTLGPDADALTARLEACRDRREAVAQLEKCRDALQSIAGRRKAEEFWNGVDGRLGSP